jgi:menaquinone-dependent protoporphyrinogen oxidase
MRVLVTWGSRLGGTEGIARIVADDLKSRGVDVAVMPAAQLRGVGGFDAAIVGGALYASRWHKAAVRFVSRHIAGLRRIPVWLFSSGPLDASADRETIPPVKDVAVLMERVGALGHTTFGGKLPTDARGFPASAMAKKHAGDWRNPARVHAWAAEIASALPGARPGEVHEPAGRSLGRLIAYGAAGWALCAITMAALLPAGPLWLALTLHAIAAPVIFAALSRSYFSAPGARQPLLAALAFTAVVAGLDAVVVAGLVLRSFDMFSSVVGTWLPFALIFLATWASGEILAMIPERRERAAR